MKTEHSKECIEAWNEVQKEAREEAMIARDEALKARDEALKAWEEARKNCPACRGEIENEKRIQ